jgi:hypothetical protein
MARDERVVVGERLQDEEMTIVSSSPAGEVTAETAKSPRCVVGRRLVVEGRCFVW